jgi:hypothetical protein
MGCDLAGAPFEAAHPLELLAEESDELGGEVDSARLVRLRLPGVEPERAGIQVDVPASRLSTSLCIRQPSV